jgi:hypothetical protein
MAHKPTAQPDLALAVLAVREYGCALPAQPRAARYGFFHHFSKYKIFL